MNYLHKRLSWLICVSMLLSLFYASIPAEARTMTVRDQVAENLQGIINQASPGDIVRIPAGDFRLSSNISVKKPIVLKGAGVENTIIGRLWR